MSKSRVAPAKTVSLPRLELLAAVVNARLLKFVAESLTLEVDQVVCWTDSMECSSGSELQVASGRHS